MKASLAFYNTKQRNIPNLFSQHLKHLAMFPKTTKTVLVFSKRSSLSQGKVPGWFPGSQHSI